MSGHMALRAMADLTTPMALRVAATLNLADHAQDPGATAVELAQRTGTAEHVLRRLLDHLVALGVFDAEGDRYLPSDLGRALRSDAPGDLRADLDITGAMGRAELAFAELLHTVQTGEPGYVRRYGRDFWADLNAELDLRESFDAKMRRRFQGQTERIARGYDWGRFTDLVDVGGGDGTLLAAVLNAHPGMRGRVLDLPPAAEAADRTLARAGLTDRADGIPGSFFDPLPEGGDAYVLSDVLHNWGDTEARAILAGCARAATPTGAAVLVVEALREGTPGQGFNTVADLSMSVFVGGCERTIDEFTTLATDCALSLRAVESIAQCRTVLEFSPTT